VAEVSLHPETSVCAHPLLGNCPSEGSSPSGNCHPYDSTSVGNYRLEGSSSPGNYHDSSPIGQLPSGRFIPDWATSSLCFEEGSPYSRITVQITPVSGFQRFILNWVTIPRRLILNWATICPGVLIQNLMLVCFEKGNICSRIISPTLASGLPSMPRLKSSLYSGISTSRPTSTLRLNFSLHSGINTSRSSSTIRL